MNVTIVSGSPNLDLSLLDQLDREYIIGVDRGAFRLAKLGIPFHMAVGDFDSIDRHQFEMLKLNCAEIVTFDAIKNETDTELAIRKAIEIGAKNIYLIGVTGHRLDHFLGTLNLFARTQEQGVQLFIYDTYNRIYMIEPGETKLKKSLYPYISFFAYQGIVSGLTLTGFKYPLTDYELKNRDSLTISNEIVADEATVKFTSGRLLVIESID